MKSKVASSSNMLMGVRGDVLEPSNPTTVEKRVTGSEEVSNNFYSNRKQPFSSFISRSIVGFMPRLLRRLAGVLGNVLY